MTTNQSKHIVFCRDRFPEYCGTARLEGRPGNRYTVWDLGNTQPSFVVGQKIQYGENTVWDLVHLTNPSAPDPDPPWYMDHDLSIIGVLPKSSKYRDFQEEIKTSNATWDYTILPHTFILCKLAVSPEDSNSEFSIFQAESDRLVVKSTDITLTDKMESTEVVERELIEFQPVFPDITREDFVEVNNGHVALILEVETEPFTSNRSRSPGRWRSQPVVETSNSCPSDKAVAELIPDRFEILVEFREPYPFVPPRVWVVDPDINDDCPYGVRTDEYGHTQIAYINPDIWGPQTSGHDVAGLIKAWVGGYCQWMMKKEWNWGNLNQDYLPTR